MWAPNCVFPSLTDDTHIVGPMSEIIRTFDHLLTQLALIGLRVKVLCKHKDFSWLHFGHRWFTYFGCANGFSQLCHRLFGGGFILGRGRYR
jgi:hypothetical protein